MKKRFVKTKIVCTVGPATRSVDMLLMLIEAGMDVARLNFSHGNHDGHAEAIHNIHEASTRTGAPIPIMLDLCGPKVRIGDMKENVCLEKNNGIIITSDEVVGTKDRISINYKNLPQDIRPGNRILIDDGLITLETIEVRGRDIVCNVINGGPLKSRKGVNLPGIDVRLSAITHKDEQDVNFGIGHGVDFFALSFVRSSNDVRELRSIITKKQRSTPIISKIEKPEAISDIDNIIKMSDGIMVARGDLGVEMKTEEVPILQKMLIKKGIFYNKPVITATQMLESMIYNPRPTRAEANDVANSVFDGTDCVMLSAETSIGNFPVEAVETMNAIVSRVEQQHTSMKHHFFVAINKRTISFC